MGAVTPETMLADYERACRRDSYWGSSRCDEGVDDAAFYYRANAASRDEEVPIFHKAMLYVIARDQGMAAATLWKLTDGAIDPRVTA